jgi:hypothetical protein
MVAVSAANGTITGYTDATLPGANTLAQRKVVGRWLGATDSDGYALLKLDV